MTNEKKSIAQLINSQHEQDEETEFYPSTQEIVNKAAEWISEHGTDVYSVLDIGCGNGAFFEKLDKTDFFYNDDYKNKNHFSKFHQAYKKYGIEKSFIIAEQLPEDVILLGSDFRTNTLIDKKVDCIFCNPPYSRKLKEAFVRKAVKESCVSFSCLFQLQRNYSMM